MSKRRLNALYVIIAVAIIAAVYVVAIKYFSKSGTDTSANKKLIQFDILVSDLKVEEAQSIKEGEGTKITFGKTNTDSGLVKSVTIEPYKVITKNTIDGEFVMSTNPINVQAIVTVEKEVDETSDSLKGEKEEVRIGEPMPFLGKGFGASQSYVVDIREVSK